MRDENAYKRAFWTWFIDRAHQPGRWGYQTLDSDVREHLETCGIDVEYSELPDVGSIVEWGNTLNPNITVPAIKADQWSCNCNQYGSGNKTMFIAGETSIGEIILAVIKIADEQAEEGK